MENKRYNPKVDKLFWFIVIFTSAIMLPFTVLLAVNFSWVSFILVVLSDIMVAYFIISPLFGYVELRSDTLFIKFGFFISREIPYAKIRGTKKERKWYSDSMLSLKNSLEHVNIKYNSLDFVTVSVVDNDAFIKDIEIRI